MNHRVPFLVALPIETSLKYGRELLRGIQRFIKSNSEQDWIAVVEQRGLESDKPDWLRGWSGHGVISRYTTEELKASLRQRGIPFVDTTEFSTVPLTKLSLHSLEEHPHRVFST